MKYDKIVVGKNMFGDKMKNFFKKVGFLKIYMNYCLCVMFIIELDRLGFEVWYIMFIFGY